ncbi:MAG TPA: TetR family transcriptional regulator, partial [Planctomycetes bacterium]|nr:TetR family transcriptional regulator [Planctomycetota bacterium]
GDRLAAWVEAHLARDAESDPRRVACWVGAAAEATRDPEVAAAFRSALERSHAGLVELVREALRARGMSTRPARSLAAAIQASVQGYFLLSLTAPDAVPAGSASSTLLGLLEGLL